MPPSGVFSSLALADVAPYFPSNPSVEFAGRLVLFISYIPSRLMGARHHPHAIRRIRRLVRIQSFIEPILAEVCMEYACTSTCNPYRSWCSDDDIRRGGAPVAGVSMSIPYTYHTLVGVFMQPMSFSSSLDSFVQVWRRRKR